MSILQSISKIFERFVQEQIGSPNKIAGLEKME